VKKVMKRKANGSKRVMTVNDAPSKTDQSWAKDADVNTIVEKFRKTGKIELAKANQGVYADIAQISDLSNAYDQVKRADEAFMTIPSEIRNKLGNDPKNLVPYLNDPKNKAEAMEYGLIKDDKGDTAPPPSPPSQTQVTPQSAESPSVPTDPAQ
jgi:phage internal scaffolding protein